VLAFDLEAETPRAARVHALTRRPYRGTMVHLRTVMGRELRVTEDHPVVLWSEEGSRVVPAREVQPGDQVGLLCDTPATASPAALDLIELLAATPLEADVLVAPVGRSFTEQYPRFARHIPPEVLRCPEEIRNNNRMRLSLYRALRQRGLVEVDPRQLQLY